MTQIWVTEMIGHQSSTSPGSPTSPSGGHAGKASQVDITSAPGDRTARTLQVARGSLGKCFPTFLSQRYFLNHHMVYVISRSASKEEPSQKRHKIVENGYNLGRDWFVKRALAGGLWKGHQIWWRANVEWRTGLLEPGSKGVPPRSTTSFIS